MSELLKASKTIDCSGKVCPIPIIETAKAIKKIEVGQILKTISTDLDFASTADVNLFI